MAQPPPCPAPITEKDIADMPGYETKDIEDKPRASCKSPAFNEEISNSERLKNGRLGIFYRHRRIISHVVMFCLFTGWWVASLVLHRHDRNWVVPFLIWLGIMLRLAFFYVSVRYVTDPIRWVWQHTALPIYMAIPNKYHDFAGGLLTFSVMAVGSFVSEEVADNTRANRAVSLFGIAFVIFGFWATSTHRRHVNWRTVSAGMLSQYVIGLFVLRTQVGYDIFSFIAHRAGDLLSFARKGVAFLMTAEISELTMFFFSVIPAIIFFIALVQVLYHIGFLQWFVKKFAIFVNWALCVSGAEAVVAAATPFIGQGESAMLVRPFVPHMTKAEIHQVMTCGFATISGSVLIGYINLGLNAEALVSSCIMSIPASLAISKLRYPEVEETLTGGEVVIPDEDEKHENALHAFSQGTVLGIRIAGTIVSALLCIIAIVSLINALMTWWGRYINIDDPTPLTLQLILGYLLYPVSFLLGVPRNGDLLKVAKLISEKIIVNEYSAFTYLATDPEYVDLSPRSRLIATYAICGFGNIGSLGMQIAVLGQLAPSRAGDISRLAVSALISGVTATLTSASVAGLVVTTQISNFGPN
ncbi:hypothetical protein Neosp_014207 [[Neocosmospora] mangrovei]